MEYTLEYLENIKTVQVVVSGRVNFKLAQQYSLQAIKLARENNCKKYLINHLKTLSEEGVYKLHTDGDALEKFGFKSGDKLAVVISRGKNNHYFGDETDTNAKWCTFKYFDSVAIAVLWLTEEE